MAIERAQRALEATRPQRGADRISVPNRNTVETRTEAVPKRRRNRIETVPKPYRNRTETRNRTWNLNLNHSHDLVRSGAAASLSSVNRPSHIPCPHPQSTPPPHCLDPGAGHVQLAVSVSAPVMSLLKALLPFLPCSMSTSAPPLSASCGFCASLPCSLGTWLEHGGARPLLFGRNAAQRLATLF